MSIKATNIKEYDFRDLDVTACPSRTTLRTIYLLADHKIVYLDEEDAIAIAKHFNLSEEDLS